MGPGAHIAEHSVYDVDSCESQAATVGQANTIQT